MFCVFESFSKVCKRLHLDISRSPTSRPTLDLRLDQQVTFELIAKSFQWKFLAPTVVCVDETKIGPFWMFGNTASELSQTHKIPFSNGQ